MSPITPGYTDTRWRHEVLPCPLTSLWSLLLCLSPLSFFLLCLFEVKTQMNPRKGEEVRRGARQKNTRLTRTTMV